VATGPFPWVKMPGRGFDHPPLSSAIVKKKSRVMPLLSHCTFVACSRVNCTCSYTCIIPDKEHCGPLVAFLITEAGISTVTPLAT